MIKVHLQCHDCGSKMDSTQDSAFLLQVKIPCRVETKNDQIQVILPKLKKSDVLRMMDYSGPIRCETCQSDNINVRIMEPIYDSQITEAVG